jgi:hypothetical protein
MVRLGLASSVFAGKRNIDTVCISVASDALVAIL